MEQIFDTYGITKDMDEVFIKMESEGYMPLVIEREYTGIDGFEVWSMCHYYRQNGDTMYDPIVKFWVSNGEWYPFYYALDGLGVSHQSIIFSLGKPVQFYPRMQNDCSSFCSLWVRNIHEQGFLDGEVHLHYNHLYWEREDFAKSAVRLQELVDSLKAGNGKENQIAALEALQKEHWKVAYGSLQNQNSR